MFLVGVPEETSIVEAGAQHTFIAMADGPIGVSICIQDGKKVGRQLALRVLDGEILLVVTHYRNQHFFRQRKIFPIKAAKYS